VEGQHVGQQCVYLRSSPAPRRLMCNELYQQIHQVAYRSAQGTVDPLAAGVGGDPQLRISRLSFSFY
jgi:hypothetical protein